MAKPARIAGVSWYHAVADFSTRKRFFWNRDREGLISELLIPLLSKQVVATRRRGKKSLFNLGSVSYFTIVKTKHKLQRAKEGEPPRELSDNKFLTSHNATEEFIDDIRAANASPLVGSFLQSLAAKSLKQIFVVMQFGDEHLDSAYEGVIKPVGQLFGYKVVRIDEVQNGGNVTAQILENITRSAIVLAELSGERPNCYYEAGYAHALGKEIIFVIQKKERIHFDLSSHRFIQWTTENELRNRLQQRLDSIVSRESE